MSLTSTKATFRRTVSSLSTQAPDDGHRKPTPSRLSDYPKGRGSVRDLGFLEEFELGLKRADHRHREEHLATLGCERTVSTLWRGVPPPYVHPQSRPPSRSHSPPHLSPMLSPLTSWSVTVAPCKSDLKVTVVEVFLFELFRNSATIRRARLRCGRSVVANEVNLDSASLPQSARRLSNHFRSSKRAYCQRTSPFWRFALLYVRHFAYIRC